MTKQLSGRTIFLTGAGGLLGKTYIRRMLAADAMVAATELPGPRSDALIEEFGSHDGFRYLPLDVCNEQEVAEIFTRFRSMGWEPNVTINNAAITGELLLGAGGAFTDFASTPLEDWNRTLQTNLTGAFLIARQMDRDIVGRVRSTLINVASMYALRAPHPKIYRGMPFRSFAAYSASKAGVHGLTLWLASHWADRNATVNTIAPGAVYNDHSPEFQRRIGELVMTGQMATPDQIADVMLFLCSAQADYMTGQLVNVDGGYSAW